MNPDGIYARVPYHIGSHFGDVGVRGDGNRDGCRGRDVDWSAHRASEEREPRHSPQVPTGASVRSAGPAYVCVVARFSHPVPAWTFTSAVTYMVVVSSVVRLSSKFWPHTDNPHHVWRRTVLRVCWQVQLGQER